MNKAELYQYVDLTSLKEDDSVQSIQVLCETGIQNQVAAICVYPLFVSEVKKNLSHTDIQVATVANFPTGIETEKQVMACIELSIKNGADEIDVVFPYKAYLTLKKKLALKLIRQCKAICGKKMLKVIVESGVFSDKNMLSSACLDIIDCGADFLKTSTGKIERGATLDNAKVMLEAIKSSQTEVGFKASGGIKRFVDAHQYVTLAQNLMSADWVTTAHFRIGTSNLI